MFYLMLLGMACRKFSGRYGRTSCLEQLPTPVAEWPAMRPAVLRRALDARGQGRLHLVQVQERRRAHDLRGGETGATRPKRR